MAIATKEKTRVIDEFRQNKKDTGSPEVQVALLTERINHLTEHLKAHVKDNHSRYGLIRMVGQRKRLLDYVRRVDADRYRKLISHLNLRK